MVVYRRFMMIVNNVAKTVETKDNCIRKRKEKDNQTTDPKMQKEKRKMINTNSI